MPLYADHHRPPSETPLNAFLWANIECWFVIFLGIKTSIAKKPFLLFFRGRGGGGGGGSGGSGPLSLSLDPHMFVGCGQLNTRPPISASFSKKSRT